MTLVTEHDAQLRWCPFARVALHAGSGGATANRHPSDGSTDRHNSPAIEDETRCIGSRCMAWRWQDAAPDPDRSDFQQRSVGWPIWKAEDDVSKVDRTTGYGNPFVVGETPGPAFAQYHTGPVENAAQAVRAFQALLVANLKFSDATVDGLLELRGKNLACWCPIGSPCHADVLLKFANVGEAARG